MKKIIFLCMAVVSLAACSSNDDAPAAADLILGTWQLESNLEGGIERANTCSKQTTLTFLANGNHNRIEFQDIGGTCERYTFAATWENIGNSSYKLGFGNEQTQTVTLTFLENNTKFSVVIREAVVNGVTLQDIFFYKKI